VANEAWLEWGQEILPHLAKTSKDSEQVETEETLDDEFDTRMDKLFDIYLDKKKPMTKDEYEAKKKEIEEEFEERRNKLHEAMDEGATISKEGDANAGDIVAVDKDKFNKEEPKNIDKSKLQTREGMQDMSGGESRIAENVGEVEDLDKTTAGRKGGEREVERRIETINVDEDVNEDLAKKSDARGGSKAIEGKAKEQGEVAKGSENAKEVVDKNAEKKSRLRLMTPGCHDFRKVSGPVCNSFLYEKLRC
jgi:hypothetical protein